jgi:U3 small nucleolar RNA-associated protein 7
MFLSKKYLCKFLISSVSHSLCCINRKDFSCKLSTAAPLRPVSPLFAMAKSKEDFSQGVSRGIVSERHSNQRINELQQEQSKRSKAGKKLINTYHLDQQQKERLKQIQQDDHKIPLSRIVRLNDYQKRALQKRLRHSNEKTNKTVRSKLQSYKARRYESAVASADAQVILHTEDAGYLQPEHDLEFTTRLKQVDLKRKYLYEKTSRHIFDLELHSFGPYGCKFDRSGRYSILYGQRGHLALMDSHQLSLHHEFHVHERVRDVCFLHNFSMMAVAQTNHVYIYDDMGAEIHKLGEHSDPMALEFLPYHWLLASVGRSGYLKYQDTSTGEVVSTLRTKLGPCGVMRQNPANAILHLGHTNGVVTMWSPTSSQYLVKLQCHKGASITSMAVDLVGNTMVTGGADRQIKIWDLRKFQCTHSFFCDGSTPSSIDISQRNVLGIGHAGHATFWSPESLKRKVKQPYMHHPIPCSSVETLRFRPFEDICALGHSQGISSIVIPGSGEPNLDTTEYNLNPFQDKKQRREAEIRALLDKLDPNMITLDPNQIGGMEDSIPEIRQQRLRDMQEEADAHNSRKPKKQKTKKRGRSKIQTQLRRKQANVVDHQVLKLREARDREKEQETLSRDTPLVKHSEAMEHEELAEEAPPALKRFVKTATLTSETIAPTSTRPTIKSKGTGGNKAKRFISKKTTSLIFCSFALCFFGLVQGQQHVPALLEQKFSSKHFESFLEEVDESSLDVSTGSCSSLMTCENCTNTLTCHWCDHTESCHARGSFYGCTWGSTCHRDDPPKPKENSTCAAHASCSDCTLASHFCHWCEHDNACHAVASPYGCAVGVDCYSNDMCRRKTSQPLPGGFLVTDIPTLSLITILTMGLIIIGCLTCCHYMSTQVKGAYDDLANISIAATVAPLSVIGGYAEQLHQQEVEDRNVIDTAQEDQELLLPSNAVSTAGGDEREPDEEPIPEEIPLGGEGVEPNSYLSLDDSHPGQIAARNQESRLLLHPSFNGSVAEILDDGRHMKKLYACCTVIYVLAMLLVVALVGVCILFYPRQPLYSVCNDAVAWKRIMTNIAELKFDASFEILLSLSNPNRLRVVLDTGKGSYSFEGNQFGTFEIPPVTADAMAINDLMLLAHVSPDRQQALQLLEAYYMGKLILEAEFEGTVRIPAFFDVSFDIHLTKIVVDVNAFADRSLCHCPTWEDRKNHTIDLPLSLSSQNALL